MISSTTPLTTISAETTTFVSVTPVSDYWFSHPDYWFDSTPQDDLDIYHYFITCNHYPFPSPPPGLEQKPSSLPLERIIWYDQIYRHLCRVTGEPYPDWALNYALETSLQCIKNKYIENLPPTYQCFIWLPLRHSDDWSLLQKTLQWSHTQHQQSPGEAIYRRFYYATVKRITRHLDIKFKLSINTLSLPLSPTVTVPFSWNRLLDPSSTYPQIKPILSKDNQIPPFPYRIESADVDVIRSWQKSYPRVTSKQTPLIVSLSGGVDSMVCLYIAKRMGHPTYALMINYGNREESMEEQKLVKNWCDILDIPFYVREIEEIHRSNTTSVASTPEKTKTTTSTTSTSTSTSANFNPDREFYESHTRTIRFTSYNSLRDHLLKIYPESRIDIVLGHNYDDTKENAINNIRRHIHLDNLAKMKPLEWIRTNMEVKQSPILPVSRPFLEIPKSSLIDFANRYSLPYFIDSTPKWSERGRLRDTVIPTLERYDPNIFSSIFQFSREYQDLTLLVTTHIIDKIWDSRRNIESSLPPGLTSTPSITTVVFQHLDSPSYFVWKEILHRLGPEYHISNKCLCSIISRWKKNRIQSHCSLNHVLNSKTRLQITQKEWRLQTTNHLVLPL